MRISMKLAGACMSAGLFAACAAGNGALSPPAAPAIRPGLSPLATTETILYNFAGGSNGAAPANEALLAVNGTFYGITRDGGGTGCGGAGCGIIFKMKTSGAESVLYTFKGGTTDGDHPKGGLVERSGVLYGTTQGGGAYGAGTFFKITTSGKESMLYSFGAVTGSGYDGYYPYGRLIYVTATNLFYGTTIAGGSTSCGCGTVFSMTASGKETLLHSFAGGADGNLLTGSLLYDKGKLYGTTQLGGAGGGSTCSGSSGPVGCGTLFSMSMSGKEKVLYAFTGGADGAYPDAGLIEINGELYGMAGKGGGSACGGSGCGTIFSVTTSGTFRAIYSFRGGPKDAASPFANLTNVSGLIYGTTEAGGKGKACPPVSGNSGCGAVFSVTTDGAERMLYSFAGSPDGALPQTTLVEVAGTLYGTTVQGGSKCGSGSECGTVFEVKP